MEYTIIHGKRLGIRQYRAYRYCENFGPSTVKDIADYMGVPISGKWGGAYEILAHHPLLVRLSGHPMRYDIPDRYK